MSFQKSDKEEEFFLREEYERKKRIEEKRQAELNEQEKVRLKELHHMHCPKCGNKLFEMNYRGIAIDKCTSCEGIWLDAGELEQVIQLEKTTLDSLFSVFRKKD